MKQLRLSRTKKMVYEVNANISGQRRQTNMQFKTRAEAEKYAKETNQYWPGANARVIKVKYSKKYIQRHK